MIARLYNYFSIKYCKLEFCRWSICIGDRLHGRLPKQGHSNTAIAVVVIDAEDNLMIMMMMMMMMMM